MQDLSLLVVLPEILVLWDVTVVLGKSFPTFSKDFSAVVFRVRQCKKSRLLGPEDETFQSFETCYCI